MSEQERAHCPQCNEERVFRHLHTPAYAGMSETHMMGSERFDCAVCGFSVGPREASKFPTLVFVLDRMNNDEIPRRIRVDLMTPAELAIRAAVQAVEEAGAHAHLTDAVVLLAQARESVANWVDGVPRYVDAVRVPEPVSAAFPDTGATPDDSKIDLMAVAQDLRSIAAALADGPTGFDVAQKVVSLRQVIGYIEDRSGRAASPSGATGTSETRKDDVALVVRVLAAFKPSPGADTANAKFPSDFADRSERQREEWFKSTGRTTLLAQSADTKRLAGLIVDTLSRAASPVERAPEETPEILSVERIAEARQFLLTTSALPHRNPPMDGCVLQTLFAALRAATAAKPTPPFGTIPGIVDYDREYIAGDVIRKAVDYDPAKERMYLLCSVGEVAQRVVVALASAPPQSPAPK